MYKKNPDGYREIRGNNLNPGVEQVAHAFLHAYDKQPAQLMFYTTTGGGLQQTKVRLTGLKYESGAPGHFIIEGNLVTQSGMPDGEEFEGYYDAIRRSGHMQLKLRATDL